MTLLANPRFKEFSAALQEMRNTAVPWAGVTFRSIELKYARSRQIMDGKGSYLAGGRWNPPLAVRTIYSSMRPGTAVEEAYHLAARFGLHPDKLTPRLTVSIEWALARTLDLSKGAVPSWMAMDEWLREDFLEQNRRGKETAAQAFGRACCDAGIVGFRCPSAFVPKGINLVVFRSGLRSPSFGRILNKEKLRKFIR